MKPIKQLLKSTIESEDVHKSAEAMIALRNWPEIVGPILNQKSRPTRYEKGTVWIAVSSSEWAQELRMRQTEILNKLIEISGKKQLFKNLRFGVREFIPMEAEAKELPPERSEETRSFHEIIAARREKLKLLEAKKDDIPSV